MPNENNQKIETYDHLEFCLAQPLLTFDVCTVFCRV